MIRLPLPDMLQPFATLSRKMTLFYGGLFILAVAMILTGTRMGIERYAERIINREMLAGSAVFDRVAGMRYDQMQQAGQVLSSDFGFREAAATGDSPTIASALDSLKHRMGLSHAFMVTMDGSVIGLGETVGSAERADLLNALDNGADQGVLRLGGKNYSVVAAPVKAPMLIGWVVFAKAMDANELHSLARLSALELHPQILPLSRIGKDVKIARAGTVAATERVVNGQRLLIQASPVANFGPGEKQALVLEYSLTRAMDDYRPMLWLLLGLGIAGVCFAIAGSWYLARRLTLPIEQLDQAAQRVSSGEHAQVEVKTRDELGRLATSFNRMVRDIEERERQISHLAFHDILTGLPNRALLREQMGLSISRQTHDKAMVLMCLDLDNFKSINDTLGHPTGDALLCEVAARLRETCGDGFVARLGGDEFAIIVDDSERSTVRLAREIIDVIDKPFVVNGHRIVIGTSIGVAIGGQDGDDPVALLKNADLALYRAKHEGKGGFRFFESAMDAEAQERRRMEIDLHDALAKGELELFFQPLFGLAAGKVTAFEALLRWNHPTRGLIPPVQFIPLAEDTGLIIPIGEWVLREACRVAATWPDNIRVAVNISPVQFRSTALNSIILQALTSSGLEPNRLELEITESLFIDNIEGTLASLHSLRKLGVRVALDDFGTGYSSLSYLRSFPFDKIKIDRSFIMDLLSHKGATAIIKSITTLAEALGMETTAEGVENVDQLDILRDQGCSQIQGYYFSRPLPVSEVDKLFLPQRESQAA
jgi:diguanylate cyclase (GGDEF)-like protein